MSEAGKSAKVMSGPGEPVEKLPWIREGEEKSVKKISSKSVNKEMAGIKSVSGDAKSVMKKVSKSKPSKEITGPGEVERKLVRQKSRMVSELSSKWEAALFHGLLIKVSFNGSPELLAKPSLHRCQWLLIPAA